MKLDPDDPEAHRILGAVKLMFEGDMDKAIFHHKKAIEICPSDTFHLARYAVLLSYLGETDQAIEQLDNKDRIKFYEYVRTHTSFNQGNMFITKSKEIMNNYYLTLFDWLKKCEDIFGFKLEGYGKTRLYAFLAERFLSYWFKENTNYLEWPILFHDLRK